MSTYFRDAEALAARAWDITKDADEPVFATTSSEHRNKLVSVVEGIVDKGVGSGLIGLERFEKYVRGVTADGIDFTGRSVAKPSAEFVAAAAKRRDEFNAKEADLLAKELDRVDKENAKEAEKEKAEEAKADAKVDAAISADKPAEPKAVVVPKPAVPVKPATVPDASPRPVFQPSPAKKS